MRCSRCGEEMRIKNIRTGTDRYGNPIYHQYAICYHCRIKRDLEKRKNTSGSKRRRRKRKSRLPLLITLLLLLIAGLTAGFFFYKKIQSGKDGAKGNIVSSQRKNLIEKGDYNDLKLGMTVEEVEGLIGTEGTLLTRTTVDTTVTERFQWVTEEGDGTVLLTFQGEKLTSISQTGLKDVDSSEVSNDSIAKLKPGMTLSDVSATLGSNGIRISETILDGVTTSVYGWKSSDSNALYSVVFVDDKMQHVGSPNDIKPTDAGQNTSTKQEDTPKSK